MRTEVIKIRVTPEEKEKLRAISDRERITLARLIRDAVLEEAEKRSHARIKKVIVHAADPELIRQVARIGNNINQIARALNMLVQVSGASSAEAIGLLSGLVSIERDLKELVESVTDAR
jgi:hypothetical protein